MEPPEEVNTSLRTPPCRQASSTLIVPSTLSRASSSGSATLTRTSICAARWQTTSGAARLTSSGNNGSVTSNWENAVSYTHLRAHETPEHLVCRLLLEK